MKNKRQILFFISFCVLAGLLILPDFASAMWSWGEPLVPCGTSKNPTPCNRCELFHLLKNLMDFIVVAVVPIVGTFLVITAGVFYILGAANPSLLSRGKSMFSATLTGIIVIALAWLITNTIISRLGDNVAGNWYDFKCAAAPPPVVYPAPTYMPAPPTPSTCDPKLLAQQHNNAMFPAGNSPEVNRMILCLKEKLPGIPFGKVSTADENNPLCNYTRGQIIPACAINKCSHSPNSCHYGGATGTQGALAVDLGLSPRVGPDEVKYGDQIIKAAYECGAKGGGARCEGPVDGKNKIVPCTSGQADHVHITTASCDRN